MVRCLRVLGVGRDSRPHAPDAEDEETIRLLNGVPVDA